MHTSSLEGERIYLRAFESSDLNDLNEYASVYGVGEMAGWKHHESLDESEVVLDMLIKARHVYAIVLRANDKLIGSIGLSSMDDGMELGYVLNRDYWNRGIMTEAIELIISYCFDELKLSKIYSGYYTDNLISKRLNKKFGFKYLRKDMVNTLGLGKKERVLTVLEKEDRQIRFTRINKENKEEIKDLYFSAFPKEERIAFWYLCLKAKKKNADFIAIYDKSDFIGLAYLIYHRSTAFLFFFAVKEEYRGRGYGSLILGKLKSMYKNKKIVLWVETTDETYDGEFENLAERWSRKGFYQRNGFSESICKIRENGVRYDILEHGGFVSKKEMHDLLKHFFIRISYYYHYKFK